VIHDIQPLTGGDDAVCRHNGTNYSSIQSSTRWLAWDRHLSENLSTVAGYRFRPPAFDVLDPDELVGVFFRPTVVNNAPDGMVGLQLVVEPTPAAPWANTTTDRPNARFDAAVLAGATVHTWDTGPAGGGSLLSTGPDLADEIAAVMQHEDWVDGESQVGVLVKAPIADPTRYYMQVATMDSISVRQRPTLRMLDSKPNDNAAFTAVDVGYSDGISPLVDNTCTVYVPGGPPPPGGWWCAVICHGGFYRKNIGGPQDIPKQIIGIINQLGGVAVVPRWPVTQTDILVENNVGPSFPDGVTAMKVLGNHLDANAEEFRINPAKKVIIGESAGGSIAKWVVCSQGDTATYTNSFTGNPRGAGIRSDVPGHTRPDFDLDRNGMVQTHPYIGAFSCVGPVSLSLLAKNPSSAVIANFFGVDFDVEVAPFIHLGRTGYMGSQQIIEDDISSVNPGYTWDEMDLDSYIAGWNHDQTGPSTCYGSTKREPQYPIAHVGGTLDVLVPIDRSQDRLFEALDQPEFDYDLPPVGTFTPTGLTRYQLEHTHEGAFHSDEIRPLLREWLAGVVGFDIPPEPRSRVVAVMRG